MNLPGDDALVACVELGGRTGARGFEIGYDPRPDGDVWYAFTEYHGRRIRVDGEPGPAEVADALARRLLIGAQCTHCLGRVVLSDDDPVPVDARFVDGRPWPAEAAAAAERCRWERVGRQWVRGCEDR